MYILSLIADCLSLLVPLSREDLLHDVLWVTGFVKHASNGLFLSLPLKEMWGGGYLYPADHQVNGVSLRGKRKKYFSSRGKNTGKQLGPGEWEYIDHS